MTKIKSKSKTSKTNRKPGATPPKPQAKKGKTATRKPGAKEKDQPTDVLAGPTESESPATATAESAATVETPVANTSENASVTSTASEKPAATAATSDSRMPAIGTVLQKQDRQGTLRCECEVVEGGVRYGGAVYRSLSSAAVAAAKDLGLAAKALNGFTFWGVTKPARAARDPLAALQRAWDRYQSTVESAVELAKKGDHRDPVLTTLLRHVRVLQNQHDETAA